MKYDNIKTDHFNVLNFGFNLVQEEEEPLLTEIRMNN